ncbi:MAG: multicopper oxidase domain-containing protein [Pseudomonadota bacterium]
MTSSAALLAASQYRFASAAPLRPKLPIPALVDGTSGEPVNLDIRRGEWSFMPGVRTPTLGFSQDYLGPTIRTRQHTELNLHYRNSLAEKVAIHGHGLHVPGDVDGGPQLAIAPGDRWQPSLSIVQPAATCWYHSHTHGKTGSQTYNGLAGMLIIDDDAADSMDLPRRYGTDDLPVIIQDRTFDAQGRLVYSLSDAGEDGWLGETVVINGAIAPVASVPAGNVRLRLLNGANARFYIVAFADNRSFQVIASDGGLLPRPVSLKSLEMAPGERYEIVVDLSDGKPAHVMTLFEDEFDEGEGGVVGALINRLSGAAKTPAQPSLTLRVDPALAAHRAPMPDRLITIVHPKAADVMITREFVLDMDGGAAHVGNGSHAAMDMTINGAAMNIEIINERVKRGVWERWRIRSNQGEHPFHVHGCSFLIERMGGAAAPPAVRGWKDMVILDDDDWSELVVRFDYPASDQFPYMYHCHILEHEDRGMMGQFTVT